MSVLHQHFNNALPFFSWRIVCLGLFLSACLLSCSSPEKIVLPPAPVNIRPTSLTAAAASALSLAVENVNAARQHQTLWIAALSALQKAQSAAQEFDSEATIQFADRASELCVESAQQTQYPALILKPEK